MPELADWITPGGMIAILAFLWYIKRDLGNQMSGLRARMARLEGLVADIPGQKEKPSAAEPSWKFR